MAMASVVLETIYTGIEIWTSGLLCMSRLHSKAPLQYGIFDAKTSGTDYQFRHKSLSRLLSLFTSSPWTVPCGPTHQSSLRLRRELPMSGPGTMPLRIPPSGLADHESMNGLSERLQTETKNFVPKQILQILVWQV